MKKLQRLSVLLFSLMLAVSSCADVPEISDTVATSPSVQIELSESVASTVATEASIEDSLNLMVIPDEYYEVIDSIVNYVNEFDPNALGEYIGMSEISGMGEICFSDNPLSLIGFAFLELDGDGTAELAVVSCEDPTTYPRILELYTFYDGEVQHILSGWARNRYYVTDDMGIYNSGSNGAAYSVERRYMYDEDSHELVFVDSYYTLDAMQLDSNSEGIILCYTTDEDYVSSWDIESDSVQVIDEFTPFGSFSLYYDIDESDLYDYDEIITLADYSGL